MYIRIYIHIGGRHHTCTCKYRSTIFCARTAKDSNSSSQHSPRPTRLNKNIKRWTFCARNVSVSCCSLSVSRVAALRPRPGQQGVYAKCVCVCVCVWQLTALAEANEACIFVCKHNVYMFIYVCVCDIYIYIHIYIYIYIYAHTYLHTHTHTHTHTHRGARERQHRRRSWLTEPTRLIPPPPPSCGGGVSRAAPRGPGIVQRVIRWFLSRLSATGGAGVHVIHTTQTRTQTHTHLYTYIHTHTHDIGRRGVRKQRCHHRSGTWTRSSSYTVSPS